MKAYLKLLLPVLMVAFAVPVFAGDYECTASTQECLDMMAAKLKAKGWVGVELAKEEGQLIVTKVIADSPAKAAGIKEGDVFYAVNGVKYADESEEMNELRAEMNPGKVFTFTVLRKEKEKELEVTLATLPDDVLAQWVGRHMLDHAKPIEAEEE